MRALKDIEWEVCKGVQTHISTNTNQEYSTYRWHAHGYGSGIEMPMGLMQANPLLSWGSCKRNFKRFAKLNSIKKFKFIDAV